MKPNTPRRGLPSGAWLMRAGLFSIVGFVSHCGGKAGADSDGNASATEASDDDDDDDDARGGPASDDMSSDGTTEEPEALLEDPGEPEPVVFVTPGASDAGTRDDPGCDAEAAENGEVDTGVTSFDAYFQAAAQGLSRAAELEATTEATLSRLADIVQAEDTTPEAIAAAFRSLADANTVGGVELLVWPARCPSSAPEMIAFLSTCDDAFAAPDSIACEGSCLTPRATDSECTGDAEQLCRESNAAECNAVCEGGCGVALGEDGSCAGSCEGVCIYAGTCAEDAELECRAANGSSVACDGACEGSLIPADTPVECESAARAKAWVEVECRAPTPVARYELSPEPDDADAFESTLSDFLAEARTVFELNSSARLTLQAQAVLADDVDAVVERMEASADGADSDSAGNLACGIRAADPLPFLIGSSGAELNDALTATSAIISGIQ